MAEHQQQQEPPYWHPLYSEQTAEIKARIAALPSSIIDIAFPKYAVLARNTENASARDELFDDALKAESDFANQEKFGLVQLATDAEDLLERLVIALREVRSN